MSFDDETDKTCELFLKASLSHKATELLHIGSCHNCEAVLDEGVFCDSDCEKDYSKRNRSYSKKL